MLTAQDIRSRFSACPGFVWSEAWPLLPEQTAAAVLLPLVPRKDGLQVLLTRRTDHLHHHAGQISFPGGRLDEADASLVEAALRETREEIGLPPAQLEVLGVLPDFGTPSGFRITPVVALLPAEPELKLEKFEVAEAFEVPLEFLLRRESYQNHRIVWQDGIRYVWAVPYAGRFIWGATAGILNMFAHFLQRAETP